MDFSLDERAEAFRAEVRDFLREHLTDDVRARVAASGTYHDSEFHQAVAGKGWIGGLAGGGRRAGARPGRHGHPLRGDGGRRGTRSKGCR